MHFILGGNSRFWRLRTIVAMLAVGLFGLLLVPPPAPATAQDAMLESTVLESTVLESTGDSDGSACVDDRLYFDNDDDAPRIRADIESLASQTLTLPFAEPPGRYEILVSTFEIFSREGQEREQINVIVNGQEFGPTPDLPGEIDGVLAEVVNFSLGFVTATEPIDAVTVRHAFADEPGIGPESLRLRDVTLVCSPLESTPETTTTTAPSTTAPPTTAPSTTPSTTAPVEQPATTTTEPPTPVTAAGLPTPPTSVPPPAEPATTSTSTTPTTSTTSTPQPTNTTRPQTPATVPSPAEPPTTGPPQTIQAQQQPSPEQPSPELPVTGLGRTLSITLTALLLMALGAGSLSTSKRMAPARARLSKRYLESLERVFGEGT